MSEIPLSSTKEGEKRQIPPSSTMCAIQVLGRLNDAHPHWAVCQFKCSTPGDTLRARGHPQSQGHFMAHTIGHVKLTITLRSAFFLVSTQ